jgi:hypothetical protein
MVNRSAAPARTSRYLDWNDGYGQISLPKSSRLARDGWDDVPHR